MHNAPHSTDDWVNDHTHVTDPRGDEPHRCVVPGCGELVCDGCGLALVD